MGIFSDTIEEQSELIGQLEEIRLAKNPHVIILKTKQCPLCEECFANEKQILQHILKNHRDHKQFVKVNNVIVNSHEFFESIDSLDIIVADSSSCKITVIVDGKNIPVSSDNKTNEYCSIDLREHIDLRDKNQILIQFTYPSKTNEIFIYQNKMPKIDSRTIFSKIDEIQARLIRNEPVDWNALQLYIRSNNFNELEQRYLNGFYEYFYAYTLTGRDSDKHYESAYSLLCPFAAPKTTAATVVKFVCMKFNWIGRLRNMIENEADTIFYHVGMFLSQPEYKLPSGMKYSSPTDGLLIEDQEEAFIRTVFDYFSGKNEDVEGFTEKYLCRNQQSVFRDQNFIDRAYLIKARKERYLICGVRKEIQYLYDQIISPYYKAESEAFKNG